MAILKVDAAVTLVSQAPSCLITSPVAASATAVHRVAVSARAIDVAKTATSRARAGRCRNFAAPRRVSNTFGGAGPAPSGDRETVRPGQVPRVGIERVAGRVAQQLARLQVGEQLGKQLDLGGADAPRQVVGLELRGMRQSRRGDQLGQRVQRSEEHTSELQSLMRISYAVFCLKKK